MKSLVVACFCMSSFMFAMDSNENSQGMSPEQILDEIIKVETVVIDLNQQLKKSSKNAVAGLRQEVPSEHEQIAIQIAVETAFALRLAIPELQAHQKSLEQIVRQSDQKKE